MANSPLDVSGLDLSGLASGIVPEELTEEQRRLIQQMYDQLRTFEFRESNPDLANIVPPAPNGPSRPGSYTADPTQNPAYTPVGPGQGGPIGNQPLLPSAQNPAWQNSAWRPDVVPNIASPAASAGIPVAAPKGMLSKILRRLGGLDGAADAAGTAVGLYGALKGDDGRANSEAAERLNALTEQRMRRVDPLHQAVTQLAWGRLPINARQGITPPTYQPLP